MRKGRKLFLSKLSNMVRFCGRRVYGEFRN